MVHNHHAAQPASAEEQRLLQVQPLNRGRFAVRSLQVRFQEAAIAQRRREALVS